MGYGGRSGRVGSTSRQESNERPKEKKENKPPGVLTGNSPSTHRVLTGYSQGTRTQVCSGLRREVADGSKAQPRALSNPSGAKRYSRVLPGTWSIRAANKTKLAQ